MITGQGLADWRDARRQEPLQFSLDGDDHDVPDHPARVWVLALLSDEPHDLLLDVVDPELAKDLWDDVCDPDTDLTSELLQEIGRALLGAAAGRPWWQVSRLVSTLAGDWPRLHGRATDQGLGDPLDWPVARLCDWVYFRLVDGRTDKQRQEIDQDLATQPADTVDETSEDTADEASGWLQMAAAAGVAESD